MASRRVPAIHGATLFQSADINRRVRTIPGQELTEACDALLREDAVLPPEKSGRAEGL